MCIKNKLSSAKTNYRYADLYEPHAKFLRHIEKDSLL